MSPNIPASPANSQTTWRNTNTYECPYICCAVTADALKIITVPSRQSASVTTNNQRSISERLVTRSPLLCGNSRRTFFDGSHKLLKHSPAMLVILKLVEAGTPQRQHHHVAGPRRQRSSFHRPFQCPRALYGHAARNLLFDFVRRRANQKSKNCLFAERLPQYG